MIKIIKESSKNNKDNANYIKESSLSRIIQHIESGRTFAIISAYRGYNDINGWQLDYPKLKDLPIEKLDAKIEELDEEAHKKLKNELWKISKFGIIEQGSGFQGVDEKSFFIPNIKYEQAFEISNRYKQKSMLWKDDNFFGEIFTINYTDKYGTHKMRDKGIEFQQEVKNGVITFDPEILKYAYSQLFRANKNQRKKYAFVVKENVNIDDYQVYEKCQFSTVWTAMGKSKNEDNLKEYKNIFTNEIVVALK